MIDQQNSPSYQTYLEPLAEEEDSLFLANAAEVTSLFGNIREIFGFQQKFLAALEEAVDAEPSFHTLDAIGQFKVRQREIERESTAM